MVFLTSNLAVVWTMHVFHEKIHCIFFWIEHLRWDAKASPASLESKNKMETEENLGLATDAQK